jgi:FkbM family methyltransferase
VRWTSLRELTSLGLSSIRLLVMLVAQPRTMYSLIRAHVPTQIMLWRRAKRGQAAPITTDARPEPKPFFFPSSPHAIRYRPGTSDAWTILEWLLLLTRDNAHLPAGPLSTVVDLGANIGVTSCLFARLYPEARIISVEPEPSNYELLCRNTAPWPSITAVNAAVWGEKCSLCFVDPHEGHWGVRVIPSADSANGGPPSLTMAEIIEGYDLKFVDLLKIDIEGAEKAIFESSDLDRWLSRVGLIAIELHPQVSGASEAVHSALGQRQWSHRTWGNLTVFQPPVVCA